jgi:hypothetical protein
VKHGAAEGSAFRRLNVLQAAARRPLHALLCVVVFLALLASRRWQQLVRPQVWNEDGIATIHGVMTAGWSELFAPVNGYLVTSSKLISGLSLAISVTHYPGISTALTWAFIALVGLAIVLAPTSLRGRTLCALAVFLVPSDPEVFGVPLYSFWWASLLLFLVALWEPGAKGLGWRLAFVLLGGLSSPIVVMILPILYWRAYRHRSSSAETVIAIVATLVAAIQLGLIVANGAGTSPALSSIVVNTAPKFFGTFLLGNWTEEAVPLWGAGAALLAVLVGWAASRRGSFTDAVLFYLLAGSILLTVARADPAILVPSIVGPRYFFLPYICILWILVQMVLGGPRRATKVLAASIGIVAVVNAAPRWSRAHEPLNWGAHIRSCPLFDQYSIPVQYDGHSGLAWRFTLPGAVCAAWLQRDLIANLQKRPPSASFPYTVRPRQDMDGSCPASIVGSTIDGGDFQRSKLDGYRVIGSYVRGDADTGEVPLALCAPSSRATRAHSAPTFLAPRTGSSSTSRMRRCPPPSR